VGRKTVFTPLTLGVLALVYVAVLFILAHWGDRQRQWLNQPRWRGIIYSLSLAVYCSSWTFYGAVGSAVNDGWLFLAIYLGPILLIVFAHGLMRRLLQTTKKKRITSIADFIAYRYGKGRGLAAFVAVAAVLGSLPYIALQLKAVTTALVITTQSSDVSASFVQLNGGQDFRAETALVLALSLALFAILFGARRLDASEHHHGLVLAVAFESLVKLLAFAAVGLWALYGVIGGPSALMTVISETPEYRSLFLPGAIPDGFWAQAILAAAAIFCLPRQFHVSFVENENQRDLRTARWLFPLYLLLFSLLVIPIAVAGMERFSHSAVSGDTYVLSLPIHGGHGTLTFLSFLGGFSAATGMVIMATVALATMVSNDLVLPLLLRWKSQQGTAALERNLSRTLLNARRYTIVGLSLVAWAYYLLIEESEALAALGLVSFAAAGQFAPLLIAGVFWRHASRGGAVAGLVVGFSSWLCFIVMQPYWPQSWSWLHMDFSSAVWLSLGLNSMALVLGSLWSRHRHLPLPEILAAQGAGKISVNEVRQLATYFIGPQRVEEAFTSHFPQQQDHDWSMDAPADDRLIRFTERLLAGCIGAASARAVMTAGLRGQNAELLLEQTTSAIQFNRELLEATLDNISQGVSVVDADLRLVSWNRAYLELLNYPSGVVYAGRPVEELIRFNVERGLCGPGEVDGHVDRRMYHMRRGTPYTYERVQPNGRVMEIRGSPMPMGGYVTTFTDVTHYKRSEEALRASEKRIRFYTDNAPAMLAYVDHELRYRFANRAYRSLIADDELDLDGLPISEALGPVELDKRSPYLQEVLKGHRQHFELSLRLKGAPETTNQYEEQYALATYIPDFDRQGKVRGFFAVLQDISSRRRAELALQDAYATMEQRVEQRTQELREAMQALNAAKQEAEDANHSKTRFLAAASHDLLQPLNAARLFASVLAQSAEELPPESARLVRRVDHSLAAAEELLSALLDITRLDQGALKPEMAVIAVSDLLEKLRRQFFGLAQRRGLTFRVRPCHGHILCDPQLLQRVLMNLVSNALRYTREGGVLVGCQQRGDRLQISVWDTGPGIAEHEQVRIFKEFQRLDHSVEEKGLGLGLAICQRIARMLEAPMGVRSRLGRGSCFYISLPLAPAHAAESVIHAAPMHNPKARADFDGIQVLCLDDEPEILDGMEALLQRWGCNVTLTRNYQEAVAVGIEQAPDMLLVDYYVGDGPSGLDAANAINQALDHARPVIVITADQNEALAKQIRSSGTQLMPKPVKPAALKAMMRNLLRKSRVND
jgi:Na+/proline symporter/signal transduction histidine kinase/ActR/RegA family two-component response regulator